MTQQEIYERLAATFPSAGLSAGGGRVPAVVVPVAHLHDALLHLRDDPALQFDYPNSITAVDYVDDFELIYQLRSFVHRHDVVVKCRVEREDPVAPSAVDIWPGADFQEREIWDLMGVSFTGHPNLERIMLWDEFVGHPLRKDYGIPAPMPPEVEFALQGGRILNPPPSPGPRALDE